MGWFNTMLNVATAASSAYSASQLHAMRKQQAEAALIQAVLAHLREQIFRLKQMAESALSLEAESPKLAAGALSVVELHLHNSGITPDLFPDLADKEYAMQTVRLVVNHKRRLMAQLTPAEQAEVQQLVAVAQRMPDYNYYLENYDDSRRLAEATDTVTRYASRNSCSAQIGLLTYGFVGILIIMTLFANLFSGGDWSSDWSGVGLLLGAGVGVAGLLYLARGMHAEEYRRAKKVVDELKDKIDLARFTALDNEFGGPARARQLRQEAERFAAAFFGESSDQMVSAYLPTSAQNDHPAPETDPSLSGAPTPQGEYVLAGATSTAGQPAACGHCGKPVEPNSRFCLFCGQKLDSPVRETARPSRTPGASVSKRIGALQSNVEVTRGPADGNGNAVWIVKKKGEQATAEPFLDVRCPWCGQRYRVNAQPAHLELFCLACGQGMAVEVAS
jgi:ribosomal protein S27E